MVAAIAPGTSPGRHSRRTNHRLPFDLLGGAHLCGIRRLFRNEDVLCKEGGRIARSSRHGRHGRRRYRDRYHFSLVGAGGGFISVPFLTYCNVPMHKAIGTSSALGFPIAFAGTIGYIVSGWAEPTLPGFPYTLGYIHLPALFSVAVMSIFTAPIGAKVAHSIDTKP